MADDPNTHKQVLFTEYYAQYYSEFYRYAFYFMGSAEDAEDAVSEAITLAYAKFETLRDREKFKFWFLRILQNACKSRLRERSAAVVPLYNADDEPIDIPDKSAVDPETRTALNQMLERLKPDDKKIVLLSVQGGYSSDEIASMLGMTAGNVRVRLHRALGALRNGLVAI